MSWCHRCFTAVSIQTSGWWEQCVHIDQQLYVSGNTLNTLTNIRQHHPDVSIPPKYWDKHSPATSPAVLKQPRDVKADRTGDMTEAFWKHLLFSLSALHKNMSYVKVPTSRDSKTRQYNVLTGFRNKVYTMIFMTAVTSKERLVLQIKVFKMDKFYSLMQKEDSNLRLNICSCRWELYLESYSASSSTTSARPAFRSANVPWPQRDICHIHLKQWTGDERNDSDWLFSSLNIEVRFHQFSDCYDFSRRFLTTTVCIFAVFWFLSTATCWSGELFLLRQVQNVRASRPPAAGFVAFLPWLQLCGQNKGDMR